MQLFIPVLLLSLFGGAYGVLRMNCRTTQFGLGQTEACLYASDPNLKGLVTWVNVTLMPIMPSVILPAIWPIVNPENPIPSQEDIDKLMPRIYKVLQDIRNVYCSDKDIDGGVVKTYEWDDDVKPICHTLIYEVSVLTPAYHVKVDIAGRGAWGNRGANLDELQNNDCLKVCQLFRDGGSASVMGIRAKPVYLGCWNKQTANNENLDKVDRIVNLDCEQWADKTPVPPAGPAGAGPVGWILMALLLIALLGVVGAGVAFWWFKIRTPSAPTASALAESFSPSINIEKI